MRFEKWQALGNDYVIVEAAALPLALTPARIAAICAPHTGVGADGILLLMEPDEPGFVARLRIFNADGSESELSGNGARQAILYLRARGWTDADTFSIQTLAGEIRPTITGPRTCTVDMGRARLASKDYPGGGQDGTGSIEADERAWSFQHVSIGNPQCAIQVGSVEELAALDLPAIGPAIERHPSFPNRTNVSWWAELDPGRIRTRIFERGVGETLSSGTGACGAAVAHVARGGGDAEGRVVVELDGGELDVLVGEDLGVRLAGWAAPVYAGSLSEAFLEALRALA
jgi:diaminopimelate epimerase